MSSGILKLWSALFIHLGKVSPVSQFAEGVPRPTGGLKGHSLHGEKKKKKLNNHLSLESN